MAHLLGTPTLQKDPYLSEDHNERLRKERQLYNVPSKPIYVARIEHSPIYYKKVSFSPQVDPTQRDLNKYYPYR